MDLFPVVIGLIFTLGIFQIWIEVRKEESRLREILGISKKDERYQSLLSFIFLNHFRFFLLLMTIVACSLLVAGYF